MAARELPNLGLEGGYEEHEDGWAEGMATNLLKLSVLVQGGVIDKVAAEPGSPTAGDVYLLDETHATHPNEIAVWDGEPTEEAWVYFEPQEGWLIFNRAAGYYEKFDGTVWSELETGGGGGGGIPEAPEDSKLYGRKNAAWEEIIGGGGEGGVLPYAGARARNATTKNQSTTGTWTAFVWDNANDRDTDGFWSAGNPSRLTVPAGVTKVRLRASLWIDNSDTIGNHGFVFYKNDGQPLGTTNFNFGGGGYNNPGCGAATDVLDVVEGDYFELRYFISESFSIGTSSWFAIEVIERGASNVGLNLNLDDILDVDAPAPADGDSLIFNATSGEWEPGVPQVTVPEGSTYSRPFKGAMAKFNADKATSTLPYYPVWDGTDYDTDGFWSAANPTRLTVPAGVTMVRLYGCLNPTVLSGNLALSVYKNGASFRGGAQTGGPTGYTNVMPSLATPPIPVVEGDYFELRFNRNASGSLTYGASQSYLAIEVVETEDAL